MATIPTEKIERLRAKAARLQAQAAPMRAEFERNRQDHAYIFQPANPNSPFGKRRARAVDRYTKGNSLLLEAEELRAKADRLERYGIPEAGDAARRLQRQRDRADDALAVGDRVHVAVYGVGTIAKVNKVTFKVELDGIGRAMNVDKSMCKPLRYVVRLQRFSYDNKYELLPDAYLTREEAEAAAEQHIGRCHAVHVTVNY